MTGSPERDELLARAARRVLERHSAGLDARCGFCGDPWPCQPVVTARRAATRAGDVSDE